MVKKKDSETYNSNPVHVDADSKNLEQTVVKCETDNTDIVLETPVVKKNKRSRSKYRVKFDGEYIFPEMPALSRSMTALAIFQAYTRKNELEFLTVHDLNDAFPCKDINKHCFKNYYKDLFYLYTDRLPFDSINMTNYGVMEQSSRYFFTQPSQLLMVCRGVFKVMFVKIWRKADFDRLLKYIGNRAEFAGIEVEEIA